MILRVTRTLSRRKLRAQQPSRRRPPRLEQLEERTLLSVTVLEDFESALSNYKTVLHYYPAADLAAAAAHDGLQGLDKHDGYEWMIRNDPGSQVSPGETFSVWVQFAGAADGRAYFGFGATPAGSNQDARANKIPSLVLAANTNQLMFQFFNGLSFSNLGNPVNQTYQPDQWYRVEVTWAISGALTGRLYDSDGVTLLNTVTGNSNGVTSGFIAFRAFQSDKYFDTVVVDSDSTASPQDMVDAGGGLDPNWMYQDPPPPPINGPSDGPTPIPWDYTSVPGTGRRIQLQSFDSLQQFANSDGWVALAATNVSHNAGTVGVDWGPNFASGNAGAPATPMLAQYLFRQLPGDNTYLIGQPAALKHFFAPSILNPGQSDAYGSGLNANQDYMTPGSEIDPVTGVLHRPSFVGPVNDNGFDVYTNRHFGPLDLRLAVSIADLDPAQNPPGTKWYLMGNIYVEGDEDVTTTSRWVEITPSWNGSTFSFHYPQGTDGQFNFRTIPGLVEQGAPPLITGHTPRGITSAPAGSSVAAFFVQQSPAVVHAGLIVESQGQRAPSRPLEELTMIRDLDRYFGSSLAAQSDLSPTPVYPDPRSAGSVVSPIHDFDLEGKWL
jgi:hypothetical protein